MSQEAIMELLCHLFLWLSFDLVSFGLENILLESAWTGQIKQSLPQNCVTGIIELECSY